MKKKLIICLLLFLLLFAFVNTFSYADKIDDVINNMDKADDYDNDIQNGQVGKSINMIIGLLQIVGTGISIVVITILGAKYMLSSVEQKAEIKQRAMPIIIGMVILFGAVNMVAIVGNLANSALA